MPTWYATIRNIDGSESVYNLSDKQPFKVLGITGIGNAEIRRLEERGPFQEGVTDTGYRVDPRIITITIEVFGSTGAGADANRDSLSRIFSPIANHPILLRVARDDGTQRQIDCYSVGMLDMPAELPARTLNNQRVVVQLKAPNPIWYDPQIKSASFDATGANTTWYTGGGLIGTANVVYFGTAVSQGSQVPTPSLGSAARTVMYRSPRPTIGTTMPYDWRQSSNNYRITAPVAIGSVNLDFHYQYLLPSFPPTVLSSNYPNSAGSVVAVTNGDVGGLMMRQFDASGIDTIVVSAGKSATNGAGTITWRQNHGGGSAWAGTMSHAAIYNIELSIDQQRAVATLMEAAAVGFIGTATIAGNWDEYPVINIVGPIVDPQITNLATGEKLAFSGSVPDSATWVIDTRYGYKTATQGGSSIIEKLSDDSDLATFHFRPGQNVLQVKTAGGTSSTTEIQMNYYDRFLSA